MNANRTLTVAMTVALGLACLASQAQAQNIPKALRGKIITSNRPIDTPSSPRNFMKKMKKQDRSQFKRDESGKWVIHFVAFFNKALPGDSMGVVVLDAKKEPVAIADVSGAKGQRTLASQIVVDTTESPGKPHILQIYYARGKKPIILAKKSIILK